MRNGTFPSKLALALFALPLPLFIASFLIKELIWVGLAIDGLLLFAMIVDLFLSPNYKKRVLFKVSFPAHSRLDRYTTFKVKVENKNRLPINFKFKLDLDIAFDSRYSKLWTKINPLEERDLDFKVFAGRRGSFISKNLYIQARSLFGLFNLYRKYKHEVEINVVPTTYVEGESFKLIQQQIKKYEGYQKNKKYGDGSDFEMLRDYVKGDEYSKIDWKATARRRKPVTRIYRVENNFELSILIDCGRLMSTEIKGMSLLDYAVNSSLVLSYAALKGNDSVSFTAFGKNIIKHIPATKNIKTIKKLNYVLTDLQYQFAEADYQTAFSFIRSKLAKRSMVVLFTDIIDDSNIKIYHKYLSLLKKKHIVLLILLRDKTLFKAAEAIPGGETSIYTKAAAVDLILRRNKTIHNLKRLGIEVLDLFPEQVTAGTLNRYLYLKNRD